jgi:hypothetical protein
MRPLRATGEQFWLIARGLRAVIQLVRFAFVLGCLGVIGWYLIAGGAAIWGLLHH